MVKYSELAKTSTAMEVLSALRGRKVANLLKEKQKPLRLQDRSLIEKLRKELLKLGHERFQIYKGNRKIINKAMKIYAKSMKQNLLNQNKQNSR